VPLRRPSQLQRRPAKAGRSKFETNVKGAHPAKRGMGAIDSKPTAIREQRQRLRFDQVIADGEAHQLAEAGEIHFFHDVIAVAFDGARGDAESGRDFLADLPGGEQLEDF
jgi:hypothetical protein